MHALGLRPAQILAARAAARRVVARERFEEFCAVVDPMYRRSAHGRLLCEHLEALERRDIPRLAVEMPPRHAKSYHTSQRFPAWWLGRHPTDQIIIASYGADLAFQMSRRARDILREPAYPFATRVAEGASAVNRWGTTAGGVVVAAGVGGGLTGFGSHLLVLDDPVKGRVEADRQTYRDAQWHWYGEVARTRAMPGAVQLITMTRWHEDDLLGRILNSPAARDWTLLRLPAVAEGYRDDGSIEDEWAHLRRPDLRHLADALGRAPGAPLWPAWLPLDAYPSVAKGEISLRGWLALYQQRPTTPEGGMVKRGWLGQRYRGLPKGLRTVQTVDSSFKTGVGNDWSVIATWGVDHLTNLYLIDVWRRRVEFDDLCQAIADQYAAFRPTLGVHIEDKASGQSALQVLRRRGRVPVVAYPLPAGSTKESRMEAVTPWWAGGKLWLPEDAPWLADWVEEHVAFPGSTHDDQVDTSSMACGLLVLPDPNRKLVVGG